VAEARTKILYIAGVGRSGSTLLDNIFGQLEGFFSAGEMIRFWDQYLDDKAMCGCGVLFRSCPVWSAIIVHAFGGRCAIDASEMARIRLAWDHIRRAPITLIPFFRKFFFRRVLKSYPETMARLYRAIQRVTGCRVIVDSSKHPVHPYVLTMAGEADLYVLHVVRDPRAIAYSWQRKSLESPPRGAMWSAIAFDAGQTVTETVWARRGRYIRRRYEDLVSDPRALVRDALQMMGEKIDSLPFIDGENIQLKACHTVAGNPSRFRAGAIHLKLDDEWQWNMPSRDKLVVTMLTWPFLLHYRYPLTPYIR